MVYMPTMPRRLKQCIDSTFGRKDLQTGECTIVGTLQMLS